MNYEIGSLLRRTQDGKLVEVFYKYDCIWFHYRVISTKEIVCDAHIRTLVPVTPLEQLAWCAE